MNYNDALESHIREFDRQVSDLRHIMLQDDYDNVESPEVVRLQHDIRAIIQQTFALKVCHSRAKSYAKPTPEKRQL